MTRRCSHCSNNGHNSRTCPNRGVKLFGVRLTDGSIRKSASMGNLTHYMGASGSTTPQNGGAHDSPTDTPDHAVAEGYGSEDFVSGSSKRKKGVPWTEEEHRMFLLGLQKLGKGDWRGIARNYVITRTPTQVASHAQKFFIRQTNISRRKRRSSLFDIVPDESVDAPLVSRDFFSSNLPQTETTSNSTVPPASLDQECESLESANSNDGEPMLPNPDSSQYGPQYPYPVVYSAYIAPLYPIPFWAGYNVGPVKEEAHEVVKPTAVHSKSPINVDELVGLSKLSIGGKSHNNAAATDLSLKLEDGSTTRPSAFHANPAQGSSRMNSSHKAITAV